MMSVAFVSHYIEEPDLVFGSQKEEKDPRIGLRYHGPYHYSTEKEPTPSQVRVGIIGTSTTITLAKQFLDKLRNPIQSPETNKWLYPDYPGFNKQTTIKCDFVTSENWEVVLKESEINKVLEIVDSVNKRIAARVQICLKKKCA
jgi:hypothetical protein